MPHSKFWVRDSDNKSRVLSLYRSDEHLSASKIARRLKTQIHNVTWVLKNELSEDEYRELKALRWSIAKRGESHPKWVKDRVSIKRRRTGYFQTREREYRRKMAELLGLERLPSHVDVHHLDGDASNDELDNLILLTPEAHMRLHRMFGFRLSSRVVIRRSKKTET